MSASAMHTKEIKACAAAWLERQDRSDWSANDQAELEAWLAQSNANLIAYWRVHDAWKRAERLVAVQPALVPIAARSPRRKIWPLLTGIAATVIAVAALGLGARSLISKPQDRTFATPLGGHEIVSFADGSRIELNTNTVLRTRMTTRERIVWLDKGEAYFQVKHDDAHPFIVIAGGDRVTDLGTKFFMRRDPGELEVALLEGRVRFGEADARPQAQTTLLAPGDVATASSNAMFVTQQPVKSLTNRLSWRRGVLVFDRTPLVDAAKEFNRYNRQKLVIADPAAAGITIDGTFPTNNVEAFTDVAQHILRLHVEYRGNSILISR
jgi:transmembrane sensor